MSREQKWEEAHAALVKLARERAGAEFEEGCWLLAAKRANAHRQLGYGSFNEYIGRLFGYAPRVTYDKVRVALALERLPELSRQLRDGAINFSQARELTRVATAETEKNWLESARGRTVHEVEKLVSGHRPGSLPDAPKEPALERHVLRFEVTGETLASFREAVARLRGDAGEHLDDDATLLQMARLVLGGPTDDGRASYQVALDVCEDCRRARQIADGEAIAVSSTLVAMASCDAQHLPSAHMGKERASQDVAPAVRRAVLRRDHHRCQVPGCRHATYVDIHHVETRADGGDHHEENLVTLCGAHHRALHEGTLQITGTVSQCLTFCHADGTPYGSEVSAAPVLLRTRAFQALRGLGFGERDARQALERARAELPPDSELEATLRHCLDSLSARAWTKAS